MNQDITLPKSALVNLLDSLLNPHPDDPGPYGPIGPIIHSILSELAWMQLNPQPLPPKSGPHPEPWRSTALARTVIDRAVTQYQLAEALAGTEQSERITKVIGSQIREFVDDYCGTRPPRWPWPWPPQFDPTQLRPVDFVIAGAQFQKAADSTAHCPLQSDFLIAAERLFETGLKRMGSCGAEQSTAPRC